MFPLANLGDFLVSIHVGNKKSIRSKLIFIQMAHPRRGPCFLCQSKAGQCPDQMARPLATTHEFVKYSRALLLERSGDPSKHEALPIVQNIPSALAKEQVSPKLDGRCTAFQPGIS